MVNIPYRSSESLAAERIAVRLSAMRRTAGALVLALIAALLLGTLLSRLPEDVGGAALHDLVPLDDPGITVNGIWTMGDERTNDVFLDNVFVHDDYVVGEVNKGFQYISEALDLERFTMFTYSPIKQRLDLLCDYVATEEIDGEPLRDDPVVRKQIARLATEAEVARAKAQMKAGLLMALESCSARAEQMARHILAYGRPIPQDELIARIDSVTVDSTRMAARGLLSRSRPAVVALGSGRGLDSAVGFAEGLTRRQARTSYH